MRRWIDGNGIARTWLAFLVLAVFGATAVAGCTSASDGGAEQSSSPVSATSPPRPSAEDWPYEVADYVDQLENGPSGLTDVMSDEEAACFVEGMVEGVGLDRLAEAEVTPEDFAESSGFDDVVSYEEGRRITVDAIVTCTDFHELVLSQADGPPELEQCLRDEVDERDLAEVLLGTTEGEFQPTAESSAAWQRASAACPEAMARLGG